MKVVDQRGVTWRVHRRWLPWRRKVRDVPDAPISVSATGGDDLLSGIIMIFAAIVLIPVVLVLAVMLAELLLLLLLVPVWAVARAVRGGGWPIEVHRDKSLIAEETVHGWSASGRRIREIAGLIESGQTPAWRGASPSR